MKVNNLTSAVYTGFLLLLWNCRNINGHPQCLDFRPPFTLDNQQNSVFCQQYMKFGCCTRERHEAIGKRYQAIMQQLSIRGLPLCSTYVKEILCQECSPYAAHLFDSETTRIKRPLPGLCQHYCTSFYSSCKHVGIYLTSDSATIRSLQQMTDFCSANALTDVQYCYPEILVNQNLNNAIDRQVKTEEGCLCLEEFANNLRNPLIFRSPDDQSGRIFVGEQVGTVHIYYQNGTKVNDMFMDLTHMVLTSSWAGDERGFLGMAFHPNYKNNGKFYVYFTLRGTDGSQRARISEFKVSDSDPNKADRNSERRILEVKQPYSNHNGGELMFGIDGYLYSFLGDGGAGGDPLNNGQNKGTLLGSVLRLDIDTNDPAIPYKIPSDNPFINEVESRPEIYAYGIRNIWRCDVDEGHPDTGYGKGRIICGDVGQSAYEEIDLIKKGKNYGWNAREGFECYRAEKCGRIGPEELPIHAYSHRVGNSVTGGHVYRGCLNPNLQGMYIYGDYGRGRLFRLKEVSEGSNKWDNKEIKMCGSDLCFNGLTNRYESNILSFGEDYDGEMYMLTTNWASPSAFNGKIYRIVDPRRRGDLGSCRSSKWENKPTTSSPQTTKRLATSSTVRQTTSTTRKITTKIPITTTRKTTTKLPTTTTRKITTKIPTTSTTRQSSSTTTNGGSATTKSQITTSGSTTSPGALPACADIAIIIDGSGSVNKKRFADILKYITQLSDMMDINQKAYQIGIITFGNKATINVPLNKYNNHNDLNKAILKVPFKDENTNTSGGLIRMREELFSSAYGGRNGYKKTGILFTDGRSTYDKKKTIPEASRVHQAGIEMFVLAFGNERYLDMNELMNIASRPLHKHLTQLPTLEQVMNEFRTYWSSLIRNGDSLIKCVEPSLSSSSSTVGSTTSVSTGSGRTTTRKTTTPSPPTTTTTTTTSSTSTTEKQTTTTVTEENDKFDWSCDFEEESSTDPLCGMEQSKNDEFDWTRINVRTPSDPTGPDRAQHGEYYMYIETSNPRIFGDKAILMLPLFGSIGTHCLTFHYHMYGFHVNELQVMTLRNDNTFTLKWRRRGQEGNHWFVQTIEIQDLQATDRLVFIGVRGNEYSGDIGIDNIHLINQSCQRS